MNVPHRDHTASLLPDGKVLVAGRSDDVGLDVPEPFPSAEIFDPVASTWTVTGDLAFKNRTAPTSTLLGNGKVLLTGGNAEGGGPELYDPTTGTWSTGGSWSGPRLHHTASLLPDGRVLVTGGDRAGGAATPAELYDPTTNTWSVIGSMLQNRYRHTATLLTAGKVMVAGGDARAPFPPTSPGGRLASAELYDPGPQPQRAVSLTLTKHLNATGVVGGPAPWCVSGAKVSILRSGSLVASATTGPDGTYRVQLPDWAAKYQAKVKPSIVNNVPCNLALSPIVKHVH